MNRANHPPKNPAASRCTVVARKPRVYLAGNISKNDWRYELIPQLRSFEWGGTLIETASFEYAGPYFTSSTLQGICSVTDPSTTCLGGKNAAPSLQAIVENNDKALQSADLIVAYITSVDCYHTLAEIGRASTKRRRPKIWIVLSSKMKGKKFPKNIPNIGAVHYVTDVSSLRMFIRAGLQSLKADQKVVRGGGQ